MTQALLLVSFFFFLYIPLAAQEVEPAMVLGEKHTLRSSVLDEDRPYWVYLPTSYHDTVYAPQRFPVMYLLDGSGNFHSATGVVQYMGRGPNATVQIPEMIVIAISNTARSRDFTPSRVEGVAQSGGAGAFLNFIQSELIPTVDFRYRTTSDRILVGHSAGGLFATYTLLEKPDLFRSYIAIDPHLRWDDEVLVRRLREQGITGRSTPGSVYMPIANSSVSAPGFPASRNGTVVPFSELLAASVGDRLRLKVDYFEAEGHFSVSILSLYHGLRHVFDGYFPPAAVWNDPSLLREHFQQASQNVGMELLPPEWFVDLIGSTQGPAIEKAVQAYELNVANYPGSSHAYTKLADALVRKGDRVAAIQNLEKALELNPSNRDARVLLENIR